MAYKVCNACGRLRIQDLAHLRHYSSRPVNHYDILGISNTASQDEIKAAFLNKSKKVHPDLNPNDPNTHDKFVKVNDAYTVLGKAVSRREYDHGLAYRFHMERKVAGSRSHTSGFTHAPGAGNSRQYYDRDEQYRVFWDETVWSERDKSKDKNYTYENYYSVPGMKKKPNSYVVFGCFVIMGFGFLLHFGAVQFSRRISGESLDKRDREVNAHLMAARARARGHGINQQLALLQTKADNSPLATLAKPKG